MGNWFPCIYDCVMSPLENTVFRNIRMHLVGQAAGHVLEIGSGSGVNFPYYQRQKVSDVCAVEPNFLMQERALKKSRGCLVPIKFFACSAEALPFPDNTFDSIVATLVFCTIPDPIIALKEIQRVGKPNASIYFFEHVKMDQPLLAGLQGIMTPAWKKVCDGCHLDRPTLKLVRESGLRVSRVENYFKSLLITIKALNHK